MDTDQKETLPLLLSLEDLGRILGLGKKAIYQRTCLHPEELPPRFIIPGSRFLRWHPTVVRKWMEERSGMSEFSAPSSSEKRRPGRPSKIEQMRRGG